MQRLCWVAGAAGTSLRLVYCSGLYRFLILAFIVVSRNSSESCPLTVWLSFSQVTQYLLDQSFVMDEETLYEASLRIEPKLPS